MKIRIPGKKPVELNVSHGTFISVPGAELVQVIQVGHPILNALLMETGDYLLLETGDYILMES